MMNDRMIVIPNWIRRGLNLDYARNAPVTWLREAASKELDRLAQVRVRALSRFWPAFQVCGLIGLLSGVLLALALVGNSGLPVWPMIAIVFVAPGAFLSLVMTTKIITGEERIIYYHHEIAVMLVAAVLLWLTGQPMLPYLDITILGIGAFLACGRIGCFMVGCCHGRPNRWGVRYTREHAAAGFTHYYVGVRLFPIQLVESLWVSGVVVIGVLLILNGRPAGSALAWYVVAYDLGRFFFEFLRGDPDRPYLWSFSQPQWISVVLMVLVAALEQIGLLPLTWWHFLAAAFLVTVTLAIAVRRRLRNLPKYRLLHPHHVREIAGVIEGIADPPSESFRPFRWTVAQGQDSRPDTVRIGTTSAGIQISAGKILDRQAGPVRHYTLSCRGADMSEEAAQLLAGVIGELKHYGPCPRLVRTDRGIFHALFKEGGQEVA